MAIDALLSWDDGGSEATIIRIERTPIRWTGYAISAGLRNDAAVQQRELGQDVAIPAQRPARSLERPKS